MATTQDLARETFKESQRVSSPMSTTNSQVNTLPRSSAPVGSSAEFASLEFVSHGGGLGQPFRSCCLESVAPCVPCSPCALLRSLKRSTKQSRHLSSSLASDPCPEALSGTPPLHQRKKLRRSVTIQSPATQSMLIIALYTYV